MPKLISNLYNPADHNWRNAVDKAADDERVERAKMIDRYWAYYFGDHPKPLKIDMGQLDHNVILNLSGMVVDKKVAFLLPDELKISLPTDELNAENDAITDEATDPTEAELNQWLDDNDFPQFLVNMALSGMVTGHTFIKYYFESDQLYFALLDPSFVTVFWHRGMKMTPAWYRMQWKDGDTNYRQDIVPSWMFTPQEGDDLEASAWIIIDYEEQKGSAWKEIARDVWRYDFPPIVDWPNAHTPFKYYGPSELRHCDLNDAVNFLASNNNKIIYFHASPRVVGKNVKWQRDPTTGEQIPYRPEDIIEIAGDNAEMYILDPNADLAASMNLLEKFQNMFFTQAKVVDLATIKDKLGQITNFGVKMIFADMLADLRQKRQLYGTGLQWLMAYGMAIMGKSIPLPTINWPDPLPKNLTEIAQVAQIEKNIGTASTETLSTELGHDWAVESERLASDQEQSEAATVRMMQQMANSPVNGSNGPQPE
jgi:hypothetical protein